MRDYLFWLIVLVVFIIIVSVLVGVWIRSCKVESLSESYEEYKKKLEDYIWERVIDLTPIVDASQCPICGSKRVTYKSVHIRTSQNYSRSSSGSHSSYRGFGGYSSSGSSSSGTTYEYESKGTCRQCGETWSKESLRRQALDDTYIRYSAQLENEYWDSNPDTYDQFCRILVELYNLGNEVEDYRKYIEE